MKKDSTSGFSFTDNICSFMFKPNGIKLDSVTYYTIEKINELETIDENTLRSQHPEWADDEIQEKKLNVWKRFNEHPKIHKPERCYFDSCKPFYDQPVHPELNFVDGGTIVLKSCNQCGRFLLIDLNDDHENLSFTRHCISTPPCTHPGFSNFKIVEDEVGIIKTLEEYPKYLPFIRKMNWKNDAIPFFSVKDFSNPNLKRNEKKYYEHLRSWLGYQNECRICKKFVVNATGNARRTKEQLWEDSLTRRAFEHLVSHLTGVEPKIWLAKFKDDKGIEFLPWLQKKFDDCCFNCSEPFSESVRVETDHTRPLVKFWPLDETATPLCSTCNSEKSAMAPVAFYSESKLKELAEITGISLTDLKKDEINEDALDKLIEDVVWFFDEFLMMVNYQKTKKSEKKVADKIYESIKTNVIASSKKNSSIDLVKEYRKQKDENPTSITIGT